MSDQVYVMLQDGSRGVLSTYTDAENHSQLAFEANGVQYRHVSQVLYVASSTSRPRELEGGSGWVMDYLDIGNAMTPSYIAFAEGSCQMTIGGDEYGCGGHSITFECNES